MRQKRSAQEVHLSSISPGGRLRSFFFFFFFFFTVEVPFSATQVRDRKTAQDRHTWAHNLHMVRAAGQYQSVVDMDTSPVWIDVDGHLTVI